MEERAVCRRGFSAYALLVWYSLPGDEGEDRGVLAQARMKVLDWLVSVGCVGVKRNTFLCPPWSRERLGEIETRARTKLAKARLDLAGKFGLTVWVVAVLDGDLVGTVERALEEARKAVEVLREKIRVQRKSGKSHGRYAEKLAALRRGVGELERWLACLREGTEGHERGG